MKPFLLFFFFLLSAVVYPQNTIGRIPIIGFVGVPASKTSVERFKEFREAGFDVSINSYSDRSSMLKALDAANSAGVSLMLHCPELTTSTEETVKMFREHPSLFAYYIADEPNKKKLESLKGLVERIWNVDSTHSCYINLYPYLDDYTLKRIGYESYQDYLASASGMKTKFISFDFYPITKNGLRQNWYNNLENVYKESARTQKPFYAFVLSTPHAVYPMPTRASLMLQINVNLAYGAQALQYFTYWSPKPDSQYDYNNGPISNDGKRTKTYGLVKDVNEAIQPYLFLFYDANVKNVTHLGRIPKGTQKTRTLPKGVRKLKVKGREGIILSEFTKDGIDYFCVVNKDYQRSSKVNISFNSGYMSLRLVPNGDGFDSVEVEEEYELNPSEMLVFRTSAK